MRMATRTDPQSSALHGADSHDLIRVHGARENNLKDVSVEIPKRRLTVFTGVSGSGTSLGTFARLAEPSYVAALICRSYVAQIDGSSIASARPRTSGSR